MSFRAFSINAMGSRMPKMAWTRAVRKMAWRRQTGGGRLGPAVCTGGRVQGPSVLASHQDRQDEVGGDPASP